MIARIHSFKLCGMEAVPVTVECEVQDSGFGIHLVGLVDTAVKESLLRTLTALEANGYRIPGKKVVINLAPADLRKSGTGYDLPIALAIIAASGQAELSASEDCLVYGELGLDGSVRGAHLLGWMQGAEIAKKNGKRFILPNDLASVTAEDMHGEGVQYGVKHLREAVTILSGATPKQTAYEKWLEKPDTQLQLRRNSKNVWDKIKGHNAEKRALEIAAAGGHNILVMGRPGSKLQLVRAMKDILPPMTAAQARETSLVFSAGGGAIAPEERPFRAPHYSASLARMLGGESGNENISPGEVSLAHNGILMLDEVTQYSKSVMEALQGPLEDGKVFISRLRDKVEYPAKFQLAALTNPCPCGNYGDDGYGNGGRCTCTPSQRELYLARLSGPVYDRITMQIWARLSNPGNQYGEPASKVAERVAKARERQFARQGKLNDELDAAECRRLLAGERVDGLLEKLVTRLGLSAKAYSRILKIARTIADLEGVEEIQDAHLCEAASYRFLDRKNL